MSAGKHTPGPWRVFEHSWCETSVVADGFDHGICCLDINHATEESQEADEALMAANARLIAAAPELLEALIGLMELESRGRIMPIGKEWDAARAAVAKAEGATP